MLCHFQPLARLGASVTGLDASEENVRMAEWHAKQDHFVHQNVKYICSPVEDLPGSMAETFDGVVASEILEHVSDPEIFIEACCKLVKVSCLLLPYTLIQLNISGHSVFLLVEFPINVHVIKCFFLCFTAWWIIFHY